MAASIALGGSLSELEVLGRDAGARVYARATTTRGHTVMLVDATGVTPRMMKRFWSVSAVLNCAGARVPRRLAEIPRVKLFVMTDLGRDTLAVRYQRNAPERRLILDAMRPLGRFATVDLSAFPQTYDFPAELTDYFEVFVPAAVNAGWTEAESAQRSIRHLYEEIQRLSPIGLVHSDYHGRNLAVDGEDRIGVLDFQDAARGPIVVDWAALVYDHNRRPHGREISLWEDLSVGSFSAASGHELDLRCLRYAGLYWQLRLAGVCTRLLCTGSASRYKRELLSVARWLSLMAEMPELRRFDDLARRSAHGIRLLIGRA